MTVEKTSRGRVIREQFVTRSMARAMPNALFAFGDNMQRRGLGGQAAELRGEPNAVGVPTKWWPTRTPNAYFCDADADNEQVRRALREAFHTLEAALLEGRDVVIPAAGLGTGLAELPIRAPRLHTYIERWIARLAGEDTHVA